MAVPSLLDAEQFEILENNTDPDKTEDEKKTDSKEEAKNGATSESVGKNLKQVSLDGEENGSCIVAENEITDEISIRKRRLELLLSDPSEILEMSLFDKIFIITLISVVYFAFMVHNYWKGKALFDYYYYA
ncbi:hypothetical protein Ddc_09244 [Ditylenchus destructor]|nr:hypothetical protein Ddc_09244 [Ditylenchus destructor]